MIPSGVRGKTNSPGTVSGGHTSLPGVVDIPGHSALLSGLLWSSSWLAFWALYIPFVKTSLKSVIIYCGDLKLSPGSCTLPFSGSPSCICSALCSPVPMLVLWVPGKTWQVDVGTVLCEGEESRWRRSRTGRSLSLLQIHWKNNRTVNKVYKTTSDR